MILKLNRCSEASQSNKPDRERRRGKGSENADVDM
jgi:hypothetical protein